MLSGFIVLPYYMLFKKIERIFGIIHHEVR